MFVLTSFPVVYQLCCYTSTIVLFLQEVFLYLLLTFLSKSIQIRMVARFAELKKYYYLSLLPVSLQFPSLHIHEKWVLYKLPKKVIIHDSLLAAFTNGWYA
jgi:hypothetical protein